MTLTINVQSSNIKSPIEYDPETKTLTVRFHRGGTYQYMNVPPETVEELMESKSSGKYFHSHIRDKYQTKKL